MDSPSNIRISAKPCLQNLSDRAVSMRVRPPTKQHVFITASTEPPGIRLIRRSFMTQKDDVPRSPLLQAGANTLYLDPEPAIPKTLFEFSILPGRPHRQN